MRQRDRARPRPWHADYVQLRALRAQIASGAAHRWHPGDGISVLDVGCADRPYESLLAPYTGRYVGVDVQSGPRVDVVACAEELPFPNESFECVLCTQVLQYVKEPSRAILEMRRVLKPRGLLFLSTHGVGFVDRQGTDQWRWTQHGLRALLESGGCWQGIEILPAGGVFCAAAYLVAGQAEFAAHRLGATSMAVPFCLLCNIGAFQADRLVRRLFPRLPPDAVVNYLAIAAAKVTPCEVV